MTLIDRVTVALLWTAVAGTAHGASCAVGSGTLSFGTYDFFSSVPTDFATTVNVSCTRPPGPAFATVAISIGPSSISGSILNRGMRKVGGTDVLNYNLYLDASRTRIWGDGSAGTSVFTQPVSGVPMSPGSLPLVPVPTIYGRIPPGQDVSAGAYTDSLQISVTP